MKSDVELLGEAGRKGLLLCWWEGEDGEYHLVLQDGHGMKCKASELRETLKRLEGK